MALPWEENYQTEATPAPKPRPVQPVVMSPPAAAVAPDPLVAAMQSVVARAAPAAAPAAPAMPALPPPPKQEVNEAPVNYKRRLSEYYQRIDQMKIDAVKEAEKTAREAAAPAKKRDLPSNEVEKWFKWIEATYFYLLCKKIIFNINDKIIEKEKHFEMNKKNMIIKKPIVEE